ncbi:BON domain-containing protein [Xenophilus arseniciresistens]|uniref:BON domain-containing protein n=1 Tax=Xenophilus arseniciresistens TaxID=1283306 RepID=A0AAE3NC05_9BURK|nr:BON domain-containing protein [Xenophilus arseniciresistens]MDA7418891.1 BON domain-containing protein [Xenophilus arseniciresistens]
MSHKIATTPRPALRAALAITSAAALLGALAGCVPLVVGGAAATGIGVLATDPRSSGAQLDDQGIELRTAARIREIANDYMNITTISFNRQVLMIGTVASEADKQRAQEAVRSVPNVRSVLNEVVVGPALDITRRSNDAWITSKVKASLLDARDVPGNSFKVVTEGGVVYLMGLATRPQVERATDITRGISGVVKVVRAVEVLSDAQFSGGASEGATGLQSSSVPGAMAPGTAPAPAGHVPLPPMQPMPAPGTPTMVNPSAPATPGVVTTPVR